LKNNITSEVFCTRFGYRPYQRNARSIEFKSRSWRVKDSCPNPLSINFQIAEMLAAVEVTSPSAKADGFF